MSSETIQHSSEPGSIHVSAVARDADVNAPKDSAAEPITQRSVWRRRLLIGAGILALVVVVMFGVPWVRFALSTVSTDDAFVNGHVTFVAPRVHGQVSRVLVDDNNRVRKGDLLAALDKEPYRIVVSEKQAAVDTATADLQAATAVARGYFY